MTDKIEDDAAVSPALARLRQAEPAQATDSSVKAPEKPTVKKAEAKKAEATTPEPTKPAATLAEPNDSATSTDAPGDGLTEWLDNLEMPSASELTTRLGRWRARRAAEKAKQRKDIETVRAKAAAREKAEAEAREKAEKERQERLATLTGPIAKVAPASPLPASQPPVARPAAARATPTNIIATDAQHLDRSGARRRASEEDPRRKEDDLAHLVEEAREAVLKKNQSVPGLEKLPEDTKADAPEAKPAEKPKPRRRNPLMDQRIAEQLEKEDLAEAERPTSRAVMQPNARPHQPVWEIETVPATVYVAPYNLPSKAPNPQPTSKDLIRRLVVALVILASAVVAFVRLGILGGPGVHDREFSPFEPNVSLLSMGILAYLAWGIIYLWLVVYAIYQWTGSESSSMRERKLGYPLAGAAVLGALWLVFAGQGSDGLGLIASLLMAGLLVYCLNILNQYTARSRQERMFVDGPVGLFLGFGLTIAAMNVGVFLTMHNFNFLLPGEWWAALVVVGLTWLATSLTMTERGRIVMALGYGWGLFWIMTSRLFGTNNSALVAILAGVCAFIVILATENRRYQISHAERRALRGQATEF